MNACPQNIWNHVSGCSCTPLFRTHTLAEPGRSLFGRLDDTDPTTKGATMTPDEALATLTEAERGPVDYAPVFEGMTLNPSLPSDFFDRMAESDHVDARMAVAKKPLDLSDARAVGRSYMLMHDADPEVVGEATWSAYKATGVEMTTQTEKAMRERVPASVLERMALSDVDSHRIAAAKNPNTPRHLLTSLAEDDDPTAAQAAGTTLSGLAGVAW